MAEQEGRQMLPEVAEYIKTRDEAQTAHDAAFRALDEKYRSVRGYDDYDSAENREKRRERSHGRDEAYKTWQIATNEAWNKLGQSSDPLVRFITEKCKDYQEYAIHVLRILPATVEELDQLAESQDWCHIWGQFRDQAIEAGAMPGYTLPSAARKAVLDGIDDVSCCHLSAADRRRVNKLLDAFLEAEIKANATELAA